MNVYVHKIVLISIIKDLKSIIKGPLASLLLKRKFHSRNNAYILSSVIPKAIQLNTQENKDVTTNIQQRFIIDFQCGILLLKASRLMLKNNGCNSS